MKKELANLYTELLEAKEAESDDRKQQRGLEGEAENEKGSRDSSGVQNEVDTAPPITCEREDIERENKRGRRYGVKEDGKENSNVDAGVSPLPSSITCESNEMKESMITTTPPSSG